MFLSQKDNIDEVNFWRKNTKNFKVLKEGEPFFFLVKNEKGTSGERQVLGKAFYKRFEVLSVEEAWDKYGMRNGDQNKDNYLKRMNEMFEYDKYNGKIGCIILSGFQPFDEAVYLSNVGIEFQNSIVSGKKINSNEVNIIDEYIFDDIESVTRKLNEANDIGFTEDDDSFPEGKLLLKKHLARERNNKVVKLAKERFIEQHSKLFCEICKFDFSVRYGDVGEGYIEAHHTKPLSEMTEYEETKVEDIVLVCANCHRMLHRKRPWLSIYELEKLLK